MSRTTPLTYGAVVNSRINSQFILNPATTTGLTFGYKAGSFSLHGAEVEVVAGTVTLTDNETNIVQISTGGTISAVVEGSGDEAGFPLYRVTTLSSAITAIEDLRAAVV